MLSPESQRLLDELNAEIDRMTIDDIKAFGEYAVSKNLVSAGTTMQPIANIYTKYGQMKAQKAAELGVQDITFKEGQRQFDINKNIVQQQINEQRKQYEETKLLNERALREAEDERKRAARDWWKPFATAIVGAAATAGFGALFAAPALAAPAISGVSAAANAIRPLARTMQPNYYESAYGQSYAPYNIPQSIPYSNPLSNPYSNYIL